jgi:hypothetical protein
VGPQFRNRALHRGGAGAPHMIAQHTMKTIFRPFRGALIEAITRFRWSAPPRRGILTA